MFERLRAAFVTLVWGTGTTSPAPPATCQRCAEQEALVNYWRAREERTADALLQSKGVMTVVAAPPTPKAEHPMAQIARGMAINEIDSSKSQQPGQGSLTRGDRQH